MRTGRSDIEEPAVAWARFGVMVTAVATLALAVALVVIVVRGAQR